MAPHVATPEHADWTTRPAKFVAAAVLGAACIVGLTWSIATREPASARAGVPVDASSASTNPAATRHEPGAPASSHALAPTAPVSIARLININTASAAELELLPGIGPALAQRIIADRDSRGLFRSLNDLDRVSGIGPRIIERLRGKVTTE
jgi:competence protein ComEA